MPSLTNIQALTNCTIWKLAKQDLAYLYETSLNINKIARIVIEDALVRKISRETQLLGLSCEEIYKELMTKNKDFIQQVPL